MNSSDQRPVWDLPTRIFHWLLVVAVFVSWLASELEEMDIHALSGYCVITLLLFRVIWGFVGSRHSRFSDFLAGPARVKAYLTRGEWKGVGHNPAGGWSIIALLVLLSVQVGTGLFLTDEVTFDGPLFAVVSESTAEALAEFHEIWFNVLIAMVALHVAAAVFYQFVRKEALITAMWTGGRGGQAPLRAWWWGLLLVLICAAAVYGLLEIAPEPSYDF